ncbi:MAG: AAA family ATPase [Desulfobacteraceae bacterium]|nr:AAA family ATPase [Desulfobacteraceae bacterium]
MTISQKGTSKGIYFNSYLGKQMIDFNNAPPQREQKKDPTPLQTPQDPIDAFTAKLAEFELDPGGIIQDGILHRFGKNKSCWYVFFPGEICGAGFGNWRSGLKETWCSVSESTLTYEQRQKYKEDMERARALRKIEDEKNYARARKKAKENWENATLIIGKDHKYLENKLIDSHYLRVGKDQILYVPMFDENMEMWNLERIPETPGGKKKGLYGGKRDGLFFLFGGKPRVQQIYICEGYSTGATIYEVTGAKVYCSFNAGNLPAVAKAVKRMHPDESITIAADDDRFNLINAGINKAMEAGRLIDAPVVWPTFPDDEETNAKKLTDFNDLRTLDGPTAVMVQLSNASKERKKPPLPAISTALTGWLKTRPKNREYLLTLFGQPFFPKDVVGALAATGGTGKTFFLMSLAVAMASGGSFGPIKAPKPLKVLCVFGEDDQDELGRRFWDICKGKFPENLHAASVYGEVGPLMKMDGKNPIPAEGFRWLEETIKKHPGLDVLFMDPKSRFYGLEENNNDHGTQWIGLLESLRLRYGVTILFSTHTSEANSNKVSQQMNRGASSIVDGCRWQAGMAVMDQNIADRYSIEDKQNYVVFDAPKSNYTAKQSRPIYFKRGEGGVLKYTELKNDGMASISGKFHKLLLENDAQFTIRDLEQGKRGNEICQVFKVNYPSFTRSKDMPKIIEYMIQNGLAKLVEIGTSTNNKTIVEAFHK